MKSKIQQKSSDTNAFKVGHYLKMAREEKNMSLKTMSQYTKINLDMLEYLESDELDKLPNKAYVAGYVKSYAKTLKLDVAVGLKFLEESYRDDPSIQKMSKKVSPEGTKVPYRFVMAICAIVAPLVYVVYLQNKKTSKSEDIIVRTPAKAAAPIESQVLSSTTPLIEHRPTESGHSLDHLIEREQVPSSTESASGPMEVENKKKISLRKIRFPLYSISHDDGESLSVIPENYKNAVEQGQQAVYLLAENGETWLTYQKDSGSIQQVFLKEGEQLFVKGQTILMFLGNVTAVTVFLNNQRLVMNSTSRVKTLIFPDEKRNEYYYPLFIYNEDGSVLNSRDYRALL